VISRLTRGGKSGIGSPTKQWSDTITIAADIDKSEGVSSHSSSRHWRTAYAPLVVCAAMLGPAIWVAWCYRHQINPDAIAYFSIAQKYAAGDGHNGINAYWGPLYSWILAPFCAAGMLPHVAAKVVGILTAFAGVFAIWFLCRSCLLPKIAQWLVCVSAAPALIYFCVYRGTPDLLLSVLLITYVAAFMRPAWRTPRGGIVIGLLGALAYLAKAYGFVFFACHFGVATLALVIANRGDVAERRRLVRFGLVGFMTFLLVSLPWVIAISQKYGTVMLSSTMQKNLQLNGPAVGHRWPISTGFWTPPNPTAISVWEDPTLIDLPSWNPAGSGGEIRHELHRVKQNVIELIQTFWMFSWFSIPTIAVAGAVVARRGGQYRAAMLWILFTLGLYVGGYVPMHFQIRFLSFALMLLLPLGACVLWSLRVPERARIAALVIVGLSFWFWPIAEVREEIRTGPAGEREFAYAEQLKAVVPPGSRIASDGYYYRLLYSAYFLDARFYGSPLANQSAEDTLRYLRENRVQYFFIWNDASRFPFLDPQREVPNGVAGLKVFRLE
jgi:hypothetical protein